MQDVVETKQVITVEATHFDLHFTSEPLQRVTHPADAGVLPGTTSFNVNKLMAVACMAASAATSVAVLYSVIGFVR